MGRLLIRQLDDVTKRRLRMRAAKKGHSMEQEAREILRTSLTSDVRENEHFVDAIRRRIAPLGGVDLPVIPRGPIPDPPKLDRRLFSTPTSSPNDRGRSLRPW
jgi:plasmid stability protein